jgi:integrase/recombinase XerD
MYILSDSLMPYLDKYRQMISFRNLSNVTLKSYITYIFAYLSYLDNVLHKLPEDVTWQELRDFVVYIKAERDLADRTINACISQIRFLYIYVLHKPWDPTQVPFRKFNTYLPQVPTKQEVATFISSITDLKQKTMVILLYASGLRISEVCNLRCEDIHSDIMRIHIRSSKNRCNRYAILSEKALVILRKYWATYKPQTYLFPKQWGKDLPIDTFFLSRHIHAQEERLGWERRFTCHSFRHGFATHLYEDGVDLLTIKALLGHKSLNSTTIYVQLASNGIGVAKSPLDTLEGF